MINLTCAACGEKVPVESLIVAATQPCPHCGRLIIGGGAPRPATDSPPDRSVELAQDTPRHARASSANPGADLLLFALAIVNLLFGALHMFCGLGLTAGGAYLQAPDAQRALVRHEGLPADAATKVVQAGTFAIIGGIAVMLLIGAPMIYAGVGLIRRQLAGRIAASIMTVFAAFAGVFGMSQGDFCTLLVYGGYALLTWVILWMHSNESE